MTFTSPGNLTIIGIGGCGTKLVHKICEHDWFLSQYLTGNDTLRIYTIDTATLDAGKDQRFFVGSSSDSEEVKKLIPKPLQDHIEEIRKPGQVSTIDMRHFHLPELAGSLSIASLCNEKTSKNIKSASDVKVWWMHDTENNILFSDLVKRYPSLSNGFNGGVYRLRAVSKAVFKKAISENRNAFIKFDKNDHVAIIVGLGGGTGSGIFLDLVKYIQPTVSKIWIYAILPSASEPQTEMLNAAVALTELEYLSLHHPEYNFSIIVTSLDKTNYNGQRTGNVNFIDDFDNAFPYTFINGTYMSGENLTAIRDEEKSYAKFIFANSAVVEYQYETINTIKNAFGHTIDDNVSVIDAYKSILDFKSNILAITKKFYNDKKEEYKLEYNIYHDRTPTLDDEDMYQAEISRIHHVWENANKLKYSTGATLTRIENGLDNKINFEEPNNFNKLFSYVEEMSKRLETGGNKPDMKDDTDTNCWDLVVSYLKYLKELGEFYKDALVIENATARSAHLQVVQCVNDVGNIHRAVNRDIEDLSAEIKSIDNKIDGLDNEKSELEKSKEKILQKINETTGSVTKVINQYLEHESARESTQKVENEFIDHMVSKISKMEDKLKLARTAKNKKETPKRYTEDEWIRLPEHSPFIFSINVSNDLSEFETQITKYYRHPYMIAVSKHDHGGLLTKPIDTDKHKQDGITNKQIIDNICNKHQRFINIVDDPFNISISSGIIMNEFNTISDNNIDEILLPIKDKLELTSAECDILKNKMSITGIDNDDKKQALIHDKDEFLTNLRDALYDVVIISRYNYDELILKKNVEIESLNSMKIIESQKKNYDEIMLNDIIIGTEGLRVKCNNYISNVANASLSRLINLIKKLGQRATLSSPYRLAAESSSDTNLLHLFKTNIDLNLSVFDSEKDSSAEAVRQNIENLTMHLATNSLIKADTLGLSTFITQAKDDTGNYSIPWHFKSSVWMIGSNSRKIGEEIGTSYMGELLRNKTNNAVHDGENLVKICCHEFALPWETSISFFVSAGFIDLISQFTRGSELRKLYGGIWKHKLMHHTLGLEEGVIYLRKGNFDTKDDHMFTIEDATTAAYFESEPETKNKGIESVKELYEEESLSDSLKTADCVEQ